MIARFCLGLGCGCAIVALAGREGRAQIQYTLAGSATWWWEGSVDGGATWQRGTMNVEQSQPLILIRSWCSFERITPRCYFGAVDIDGTIAEPQGALDTVASIYVGLVAPSQYTSVRLGNTIKIDELGDTAAPGQGQGWCSINQPGLAVGPYTYADPIGGLLEYSLLLDGSTGDREIGAVFRQFPLLPAQRSVLVVENQEPWRYFAQTLTQEPLTIHVLPAPGAWALGLVALAGRRRRSSQPPWR